MSKLTGKRYDMRQTYLIIYDIRDPVRLRKLAKIAEDYGLRMQKSVFQAELEDAELWQMKRRMLTTIEPQEDGIKIFCLCKACKAKRTGAGIGKPKLLDSSWHIF